MNTPQPDPVTRLEQCLAVIARDEPTVQAWTSLDADAARERAETIAQDNRSGQATELGGLPVGIKDIIDTARFVTANGTSLDEDRRPERDAVLVTRLERAGAVVLGKTVTTELAYLQPSRTRNPAALHRTPGGSSSGSAAAVACGMVPAAVGTQTGGSIIRPASFCGVVGYKPSFGAIPRTGVLNQSATLDTVGTFARTVADAARVAGVMFGADAGDPSSAGHAPSVALYAIEPVLGFVRTPFWSQAEDDMQQSLLRWVAARNIREWAMASLWDEAANRRRIVNDVEIARNFAPYAERDAARDTEGRAAQLSDVMRAAITAGKRVSEDEYQAALAYRQQLRERSDDLFDGVDALICPAAAGPAPEGFDSTGNPVFNGLWTFAGLPAITLPLLMSEDRSPMGVQLIGRYGDDARLLSAAAWLEANSVEEPG